MEFSINEADYPECKRNSPELKEMARWQRFRENQAELPFKEKVGNVADAKSHILWFTLTQKSFNI